MSTQPSWRCFTPRWFSAPSFSALRYPEEALKAQQARQAALLDESVAEKEYWDDNSVKQKQKIAGKYLTNWLMTASEG